MVDGKREEGREGGKWMQRSKTLPSDPPGNDVDVTNFYIDLPLRGQSGGMDGRGGGSER